MEVFRRQRFLIAWIAIFGLMTNLAIAARCTPDKSAADSQIISLLGDVASCLHDPAKPLEVDKGNAPQPLAKPCTLCTATAAVALAFAIGALLGLIVIAPNARFAFDFIGISGDDLRRSGLGSRAPPLPA